GKTRKMPKAKTSTTRRPHRAAPRKSATRTVKIVLADDQPIDRMGMAILLGTAPDMEIVAESAGMNDTLARCRALGPDVLLLSLRNADPDGAATIALVREHVPGTR